MTASARVYSMSDGELLVLANSMIGYMTRDAVEFAERGVTASDITAFEALTNAFESFPPDEYYASDITGEITIRDEAKAKAIVYIKKISGYFEQKWGISDYRYKKLGIAGVQNMSQGNFLMTGRNVIAVATEYLTELSSIGLNQSLIDDLVDEIDTYDNKIRSVNQLIATRESKSEERVSIGNQLYSFVKKYSTIGKLIWEDVSESNFDDYIIYKKPTGLPSKVEGLNYDLQLTKLKWEPSANAITYQLEERRDDPSFSWSTIYEGAENEFMHIPTQGRWLYRCRGVNATGAGTFSDELVVIQPI